jgi:serine/threonine-protein kinase
MAVNIFQTVGYSGSDAYNGTELWRFETRYHVETSPAVSDGVVYAGSSTDDKNFYALNASTGEKIWSYPAGARSSPAVAEGLVFFGSVDSNVYALNASTGAKIWNYKTGYVVDSSPAVADGVVYSRSGQQPMLLMLLR